MSQSDVITIVQAYLQILIRAGIPISRAYLYGSYAKNIATRDSDIDVMLISDLFDNSDDYTLSRPWLFTTKISNGKTRKIPL